MAKHRDTDKKKTKEPEILRPYHTIVMDNQNRIEKREFRTRRDVNEYLSGFDPHQVISVFRGKLLDTEFRKVCIVKPHGN